MLRFALPREMDSQVAIQEATFPLLQVRFDLVYDPRKRLPAPERFGSVSVYPYLQHHFTGIAALGVLDAIDAHTRDPSRRRPRANRR